MGRRAFAICVWALVLATFMSPLLFRRSLRQQTYKNMSGTTAGSGSGDGSDVGSNGQLVTVVAEEVMADELPVRMHVTET